MLQQACVSCVAQVPRVDISHVLALGKQEKGSNKVLAVMT